MPVKIVLNNERKCFFLKSSHFKRKPCQRKYTNRRAVMCFAVFNPKNLKKVLFEPQVYKILLMDVIAQLYGKCKAKIEETNQIIDNNKVVNLLFKAVPKNCRFSFLASFYLEILRKLKPECFKKCPEVF